VNAGIVEDLWKGARDTFEGEDIRNADALSNEVQVRIFDEHARPGEQYNFTVIVQNECNKIANNVTVYVRPPMTLKSTKLQTIPKLLPNKSE
jgi:hypothetical protein